MDTTGTVGALSKTQGSVGVRNIQGALGVSGLIRGLHGREFSVLVAEQDNGSQEGGIESDPWGGSQRGLCGLRVAWMGGVKGPWKPHTASI